MTSTSTDCNAHGFAAFFRAYLAACRQRFEQYTALAIPEKQAELADLLAQDLQQAIEDFFAERNLA